MPSAVFYTLGCKVNQLETESIAEAFTRAGFTVASGEGASQPEVLVINTCTVTAKAEQKARRIIRWALKTYPKAEVIVTGCYAQMEPERIAALDPEQRLFVIPGGRKSALSALPAFLSRERDTPLRTLLTRWSAESAEPQGVFWGNPATFSFHSRGFLKIQDGCDNRCTYCRVRFARGPSVSLEGARILGALQDLEAQGYGEAVLTGVNIGQYWEGTRDLAGLLAYLLAGTGRIRLRLSSLEPAEVTADLPLSNPRIRPHFHLAIQSGSVSVLERMGRRYTPDTVVQAVSLLRSAKDDPFLACDMITGFPGETAHDFEASYRLCRDLDFAGVHGFPYSPRPGTAAYAFKGAVSEREARLRVDRLIALATEGRHRYIRRWLGRSVEAVAEEDSSLPSAYTAAVSENYLKLLLSLPSPPQAGSVFRCRLLETTPQDARFDASAVPE